MSADAPRPTRRAVLASGAAAVAAGAGSFTMHASRTPVVYLPHGGGPWPWVSLGLPQEEVARLRAYLEGLAGLPSTPPKAVLMISAHWEEEVPTVSTAAKPPMLYDYYGFPESAYSLQWPAPGDPNLAARVRALLGQAGVPSAEDPERGFDHGTFVPLKLMYPEADIPTVQLSLVKGLDPAVHLAVGRALAPLRSEGVYIVASGMSFHNLRALRGASTDALSLATRFDDWLRGLAEQSPAVRASALEAWKEAPGALLAHPREEHLMPLMVAAGAAGEDSARVAWRGSMARFPLSAIHFG